MKIDQINISDDDYNNTLVHHTAIKNNDTKGVIFLSPPQRKKFTPLVVRN